MDFSLACCSPASRLAIAKSNCRELVTAHGQRMCIPLSGIVFHRTPDSIRRERVAPCKSKGNPACVGGGSAMGRCYQHLKNNNHIYGM